MLLLALALIGLVITDNQVQRQERLILAIPNASGHALSVNTVEEINDRVALASDGQDVERTTISRIMLTYETIQRRNINALQSRHEANLIGTNHSHPHVLNHTMTHGRFFSQEALIHAHRVVVLNERAAFELFGDIYTAGNELSMSNMPYRVVGVIDDGDEENLNVYVPTTLLGNTVDAIAANFSINQDLSEEYILTVWQQIGITAERYRLVNFDTLAMVVRDRLILAVFLLLAGLLLRGIIKTAKAAQKEWHSFCGLKREMYMAELLKGASFRRLAMLAAAVSAMAIAVAALGLNAFNRMLIAYDARGMLADVRLDAFAAQIADMSRWYNLSNLFFWGFVLIFLLMISTKRF